MRTKELLGQDYHQLLARLKEKIRNSQVKAALKVNSELLALYWELGKAITEKQIQSNWGDRIITQLAADLSSEFPDMNGFSATNLKYIRRWYQFYRLTEQPGIGSIGQQAVDQLQVIEIEMPAILGMIPWGHHIQIFTKVENIEEAIFYLQQTTQYNWSRNVLLHHLDAGLYYKKGKSYNNFQITLPQPQSDLANELIKNEYNLQFLGLHEEANEKELENAILANIKKFMLELGSGFSFLKQQYHVKVGERDFYVDLVFYHVKLHCYFIIELKVGEFKPEHAGKLEFYITAFDEKIKAEKDNPTIGLLLCKTVDKVIVEYTLKDKVKAMGVSEYRHTLPDELRQELPDEEVLKQELKKEITISPKPSDEKINKFKGLIQKLNRGIAEFQKSDAIICAVVSESIEPLIGILDAKIPDLKEAFNTVKFCISHNSQSPVPYTVGTDISSIIKLENIWILGLQITFERLKRGGRNAFDAWFKFEVRFDKYKYLIGEDKSNIWDERAYNEPFSKRELETIADRFAGIIFDDINERIESLLTI